MNLSAPSWDLFITLFLIIAVGYGFLLQRERIVVTMVAAYVGLAITELFWPVLQGFFHGDHPLFGRYFVHANFSDSQVQIGLFVITTILVASKAGIDAERGGGWLSPLELMLLSGLAGAFVLAIILSYLPADSVATLAEQSKILTKLVKFQDLLIVGPILALVALGFRRRRGNNDD